MENIQPISQAPSLSRRVFAALRDISNFLPRSGPAENAKDISPRTTRVKQQRFDEDVDAFVVEKSPAKAPAVQSVARAHKRSISDDLDQLAWTDDADLRLSPPKSAATQSHGASDVKLEDGSNNQQQYSEAADSDASNHEEDGAEESEEAERVQPLPALSSYHTIDNLCRPINQNDGCEACAAMAVRLEQVQHQLINTHEDAVECERRYMLEYCIARRVLCCSLCGI